MSERLFDEFIIVDWSASNSPCRGANSIWIAHLTAARSPPKFLSIENPSTRAKAQAIISRLMERALSKGNRLFAGFDFPFGYPAGAAKRLCGSPHWSALWAIIHAEFVDSPTNENNRFELAGRWNHEKLGAPYFWGCPPRQNIPHLPAKKPVHAGFKALEHRLAEKHQPPAKSVWQLAYTGAPGSQAIAGIAALETLRKRFGTALKVWPFETAFTNKLDATPIIVAEIYPSMFPVTRRKNETLDRAQVRTVAKIFAQADREGALKRWLDLPETVAVNNRATVIEEEGWIVGAGHV